MNGTTCWKIGLTLMVLIGSVEGATAGEDLPERLAPVLVAGPTSTSDSDLGLGEDYGVDSEEATTIGWQAFLPRTSATTFDGNAGTGSRWLTGGPSSLVYAPLTLGDVPNGATIIQVLFSIVDTDSTSNVTGFLCQYWTNSGSGSDPGGSCPLQVSSSGTPGNAEILGSPFLTMRTRYDADSDGSYENVNWLLAVSLPSFSSANAIRQVRIRWQRQLSPAPASATFADVPVGAFGFQHVEALVGSGITAGCGGGNFCPDAPLTRVQMAVFLAKALGLHWDWNSGL